jgi:zinc protease
MKSLRFAFALAVSAASILGFGLCPSASAQTAALKAADLSHWAQDASDVKPDPRIRFGRLPNGMRYALMRNATPSGQASFRLRFAVGSLMETDKEQGLAHFLEHMAFDGSKHVPTGEMIKILERHGLAFGADTNASTDWSQTIYQLDLPKTDDDTVDTSLMLLREAASDLLISQPTIDKERGVVLSEERLRDTPSYRAFQQRMEFILPGQLASHRLPIGKVDVIRTAQRADIADIYDKYYRPDRATFVAVGDFDLDTMEAKIKARFGDWKNSYPSGAEPDLGKPGPRGLEAAVAVQAGVQTSMQVAWVSPPDLSPDSLAKRRREMIERLALQILNRRYERISRSGSAPFLSAGAAEGDEFHSAKVTALQMTSAAGAWQPALIAAVGEERRLIQYGVLQNEVNREIEDSRAGLKASAEAQATRRTPDLANLIVGSLDDGDVVTDPAQDLALFEQIVKGLTAQEVSATARRLFQGQGPLIFLTSPTAVDGGDAAIKAAYQIAEAEPLKAPDIVADKTWPYESFGAPGKVVEARPAPDNVGATFIRFDNGVRLTVKPTSFRKDQVLVQVRVGDGRLDLPKDRPTASWARGAFIEGGLKKVTAEELDQIMTKKIVGASFDMDDTAFVLSGATKPSDLDSQMQVLTAYLAEPGLRPEAFERTRTSALTLHDRLEATPNGVVNEQLGALMRSGDLRWALPSRAEIAASKPADLANLVSPPLMSGPIEVVIVGDITVQQAIAATASTLGALRRPAPTPPPADARKIAFPAPTAQPVIRTHKGRADQAVAVAAWPTTDFFADTRGARVIRVMVEVMKLRMIDELRVAQGATYSPSANLDASQDYPGYGYISASVEIPPAKIAGFYDTLNKIAADLRTKPITPDELQRATLPRIEALGKAFQTNEFWLAALAGGQTDPRRIQAIGDQIPQLKSVTAADVMKAANTWLTPERMWKFEVLPVAAN